MSPTRLRQYGSRQTARAFLSRASGLGIAFVLERGLSFTASVLAARAGGPQAFGAYVTALSTTNAVATYPGSTASAVGIRFAAEYSADPGTRRMFLSWFAVMTILGAGAAAALVAGSAPLLAEHLFANTQLGPVLRMAAALTAGMVLLEALRGILIGSSEIRVLIIMAAMAGLGLVVAVPMAALSGASAMVFVHTLVFFSTVALVVLPFTMTRHGRVAAGSFPAGWPTLLRRTTRFAGMQLAGFGGIAGASWFISAMVARSDSSLHEMAFYGVANQVRVLVLALPGLLAQAIHPALTTPSGDGWNDPDHLTVSGTVITTVPVLTVGGLVLAALPFGIPIAYGPSYLPAEGACAVMAISGVVHMSGLVVTNRLGVVAVQRLAVLNGCWSGFVVAGSMLVVPVAGALGAASVLLLADIVSCVLGRRLLRLAGHFDRALSKVSMTTFAAALGLALVWVTPVGSVWGRSLLSLVVAFAGASIVWIVDRASGLWNHAQG